VTEVRETGAGNQANITRPNHRDAHVVTPP
jgi:hypothetical protein